MTPQEEVLKEKERILKRLDDVSKRMSFVEESFKKIMYETEAAEEIIGSDIDTVSIEFSKLYDVLDACMFFAVNTETIRQALQSQAEKDIDAIWCAWYEMNAIRARDGAPECVSPDYWSDIVDRLENMLPEKYRKPWHPKYARKNTKLGGTQDE